MGTTVPNTIHHVGVTVSDLEKSTRFYVDGLGLQVVARQTSAANYLALTGYEGIEIATVLVSSEGGNVRIELQEYHMAGDRVRREAGTAPAGSSHICLRVDDVDVALASAEVAGGVRVTDPVDLNTGINAGGRAVYLRDPDGYTIELFMPPTG